jgi:aspartyl-tRNA(Asn)/glutamyl-tRNA(Gln) amidotransferase subunit C
MITKEDVRGLAKLARVTIEETELDSFVRDLESIVAYVGQLEALELAGGETQKPALRNVMRPDEEPYAPGIYTQKLVEQFPARQGDALLVKQIIAHE